MTVQIDADFPGGNIIHERTDGDDVFVRQDIRDTEGWWFYWCFRVRGAAGRELTFHFTDGDVVGVRGPAVSLDGGGSWSWLGRDVVESESFRYRFPDGADEVRFSFGMPYLEEDLHAFLSAHEDSPHLRRETLCTTRKGRTTERLHVGRLDGEPLCRVLVTCRHHCCEMMASYSLEGLMEEVLVGEEAGPWLRENVEFLIIPFVDKDGVQDGDQGKNRKPWDHNRDYLGESIYPATAAIRRLAPQWGRGRLRVTFDLHCPWIRGEHNEVIYLVGRPLARIWRQQQEFGRILEEVQQGPLPYRAADNLPFGEAWNTGGNYSQGWGFSLWGSGIPGVRLGSAMEIPYANAAGAEVNAQTARAFGHDLARGLCRYLQTTED
ncbi:MAG: peptidase M14 [Candidatus Brocadiia bacterium]